MPPSLFATAKAPARSKWLRRGFLAGVIVLICLGRLAAQGPKEYEVKAVFLLNFAKFVEWPPAAFPNSDSPVAICILGKDPFGSIIDELVRGEVANGRKLMVRRISRVPAAQTCQMVFTQQSGKASAEILGSLGSGVLTVGEGEAFIHEGGVIAFLIENRHVRFDIDEKAAGAADLKLSSRLLAVARSVQK
jgi:hypothetical protein